MKLKRGSIYIIIVLSALILIRIFLYNRYLVKYQISKKLKECITYSEHDTTNKQGKIADIENEHIKKLKSINAEDLIHDGGIITLAVLYKDSSKKTKFEFRWITLSPQINNICIETEEGERDFINFSSASSLDKQNEMEFRNQVFCYYSADIDYNTLTKGKAFLASDKTPIGQAINIEII